MKSPEECAGLDDVRHAIDTLDREIVRLIGRRAGYVDRAARFKTDAQSVRAPERRRAMLSERRRWAETEGLDPNTVQELFENLIRYFINREMSRLKNTPESG